MRKQISTTPTITKPYNPVKQEESTDMILNRLNIWIRIEKKNKIYVI